MLKSHLLWIAKLFTGITLLTVPAAAQTDVNFNGRQYVYRNWDNSSGLPQNTVYDITKDNQGYLWASTEEGLVRFDGSDFTVRNEINTPGLHSSNFSDLLAAKEGIWAASRNTILRIINNQVTAYDFRNHLDGAWITCMQEDTDGRLWVGASSGSLFYLLKDSIHAFKGWKNGSTGSVIVLGSFNGKILAGTTKGLFELDKTGTKATANPIFNGINITAIVQGKQGLWIGTAEDGLFSLGKTFLHFTEKNGLKEPFINSLALSPSGELWIGTRSSGFQVYDGASFSSPAQKYESDGIKSIMFSEGEVVWLGTTSSGLLQVKPAQIQMVPPALGLAGPVILPIYQHDNGEIWIGTAGKGISRMINNKVTVFNTDNGLSSNLVVSVFGRGDHIYVGTANGLDRFNWRTGRFDRRFTKQDGLLKNSIQVIFCDSRERLWITTRGGGLHEMNDDGTIRQVTVPEEMVNAGLISISEDKKGNLWFGSRGAGIMRMDASGKLTQFKQKQGFPSDMVYCFFEDRDGALWMGTDKGLVCYNEGKFTLFTKESGLRFNEIYRIMDDNKGFLWMSGNLGLQRAALVNLQKARDGKDKNVQLSIRLFNAVDGMTNAEANGGIFPAGWKMNDGSLWFPTLHGVAVVNTSFVKEERSPVNIQLQTISYQDKDLSSFDGVTIPPDVSNIEIHYTSIDFSKANDINYYYRLKGLNNEWVKAGNRRAAYFTGLRPGTYDFEVKAEQYGYWSETAVLHFTIKPYFYQTLWFRTIMVLLLAGAVVLIIRFQKQRSKRKLAEQRKITKAQITGQEKERQVIGTELHDNINQQLATAKLYLDFARSNEEMRLPMIEKSEQVVHNVINEIRSLCKSLIPPTLKDIGLTEALQELMASYRVVGKFNLHFECTAPIEELEEDLRFSLFRITQEQLNNIARHAAAPNVWVSFRSDEDNIYLSIKDDGLGFDPRAKSKGMGLANIKNRLELYNGLMEIESDPGKGCKLDVTVPLDSARYAKKGVLKTLVKKVGMEKLMSDS